MAETSTPYYINEDGIVALALCILKRWTIEQAFYYLETGKKPSKRNKSLTADDADATILKEEKYILARCLDCQGSIKGGATWRKGLLTMNLSQW